MTVEARPPTDPPTEGAASTAARSPSPPASPVQAAPELAVLAAGVTKRFDERDVVQDLTFQVERGQIFGIVGPSGCGKTTTIRMMLGVLRPTAGELLLMGRPPDKFRRRERQKLGYMPQLFVLFPELSVMENLNFSASIYGMGWFTRGKRLRSVLDFVELWDARKRPAGQLSGGMQRRLELAATLVHNPQTIFLDEPTAGVDPVLRAKFWDHFRELRDEGRTLIVTTQYVTESEYCDRVAVLKEGRLVAVGPPEEIRRRAMGGEVVRVTGPDLDRRAVAAIRGTEGVKGVRRLDDNQLEVIVEDAGRAAPDLLEALQAAHVDVAEVEEQRPSFDDVFVRLMEAEDARAD
jgi:ABC-2 type transport system ATP-binding protein